MLDISSTFLKIAYSKYLNAEKIFGIERWKTFEQNILTGLFLSKMVSFLLKEGIFGKIAL